ncbi:MAG: NHL repeat-containing protein [Planctomycetota bacterium]|jgi:sugar lactone lactonase YvrE
MDPETHKAAKFLVMESSHSRSRGMVGLAANDDTIYLAVRAPTRWLVNACGSGDVDIENCLPRYPEQQKSNRQFNPNPRNEFLRLLRLTGTPTGQRGELVRLETSDMPARRNHTVVAFKRAIPLGSLVFPFPKGDYSFSFSVLKEGAAYPPQAENEDDWETFYKSDAIGRNTKPTKAHGWAVAAAPTLCTTRALRITFDKAEDELDELMDEGDAVGGEATPWKGTLDGLKLLRRRYTNLFPTATVTVNSGTITDKLSGAWDAKRNEPLSEAKPALYALTWKQEQSIRGLAIKEIDGKDIWIDVWEGKGKADLNARDGWKEVATYHQRRRYFYQPDANRNLEAIYMDGYLDFGSELKTRGVRIRVTSQWTTREEDRAGLYGVHVDRGGMDFDPTRCFIEGVAPLGPLGGDVPSDPLKAMRLEVFDAKTGKLIKELPLKDAGRLTLGPGGALYGVSQNKVVKMDLDAGNHTTLADDLIQPDGLAFDKAGNLYVYDRDPERMNIRVFGSDGKSLRSIGKPGGIKAGPWDPERIGLKGSRVDLAVDSRDQLWVVAKHRSPKRQSVWTLDGKHIRDHLGNTSYGGGGCLNPWNKRQLFYADSNATLEFELDWDTGLTRLKAIPWLGDAKGGEFPVRIGERLYLTTRPRFGTQGCGIVYLYEDGLMRPVAAIGQATYYPPLRSNEIQQSLKGRPLGELTFVWSDLNGNGVPNADEVTFSEHRYIGVSAFDRELGMQVGTLRYEVDKILDNGAPVYRERTLQKAPEGDPGVKMTNGQIVFFRGSRSRAFPGHVGLSRDGDPVWEVGAEGFGVHALSHATALAPDQVVTEFDMIGYERAEKGELGDYYITNSNIGRWHLWTADGLLAGEVMRDRRDPGLVSWSMTECKRGMDLTGITPGAEHFRGYLTRTREDNRHYLVAGHNHISILEILGLEKYKRMEGTLTVTPDDIRRVQAWEKAQAKKTVYARAPLYHCGPIGEVILDGNLEEWGDVPALTLEGATFRMGHRDGKLYLSYHVRSLGPFKNAGTDWRRMFKTGAGVDFKLSVKAGFDHSGGDFAEGDLRLLTTPMNGTPMSVIYQPVNQDAPESEAWETHTMVWQTAFDRVVKEPKVRSKGLGTPADQLRWDRGPSPPLLGQQEHSHPR